MSLLTQIILKTNQINNEMPEKSSALLTLLLATVHYCIALGIILDNFLHISPPQKSIYYLLMNLFTVVRDVELLKGKNHPKQEIREDWWST